MSESANRTRTFDRRVLAAVALVGGGVGVAILAIRRQRRLAAKRVAECAFGETDDTAEALRISNLNGETVLSLTGAGIGQKTIKDLKKDLSVITRRHVLSIALTLAGESVPSMELEDDQHVREVCRKFDSPLEICMCCQTFNLGDLTLEQTRCILAEIIEYQATSQIHHDELAKKMQGSVRSLETVYEQLQQAPFFDPCEGLGLHGNDFLCFAIQCAHDAEVEHLLGKLGKLTSSDLDAAAPIFTPEELVDIELLAAEEWEGRTDEYNNLKNKGDLDVQLINAAIIVCVNARVLEKHGVLTNELELSMKMHESILSTNQRWIDARKRSKVCMDELVAKWMDH